MSTKLIKYKPLLTGRPRPHDEVLPPDAESRFVDWKRRSTTAIHGIYYDKKHEELGRVEIDPSWFEGGVLDCMVQIYSVAMSSIQDKWVQVTSIGNVLTKVLPVSTFFT